MNILSIGGSGFLSGAVARLALRAGHTLSVVTRGQRRLPEGVNAVTVDRKDRPAFLQAMAAAQPETPWDLVIDCIPMEPDDARQLVDAFAGGHCRALAFVSTDFVYDPARRAVPQPEEAATWNTEGYSGNKRAAEEVLLGVPPAELPWVILRPCHIYGPGSQLGCLPLHGRDKNLLGHLRAGLPLRLVGGGEYLQQPVSADDVARACLSVGEVPAAAGRVYNVAGPDAVESRVYYEIIAEVLEVTLPEIEEVPVETFLQENPGMAPYCCDRVADLERLNASGLAVPQTPLKVGLREHVEWLLAQA